VRDQEDDQTGGQADSEAEDIDHRMHFVLSQFADGDEPVVFEHGVDFGGGREPVDGWIRRGLPSADWIKANANQVRCCQTIISVGMSCRLCGFDTSCERKRTIHFWWTGST
jgi:hypothetical protein